jgi:hypothetical protein
VNKWRTSTAWTIAIVSPFIRSFDCLWRTEARSKLGKSSRGVYLPDLEEPRPPDMRPSLVKLRLVKNE